MWGIKLMFVKAVISSMAFSDKSRVNLVSEFLLLKMKLNTDKSEIKLSAK